MSDLRERVQRLAPEQRRLLDWRLQQRAGRPAAPAPSEPAVPPHPSPQTCPLSFGQELVWAHYEQNPDGPCHNVPIAVRFRGPLDAPTLERSVAEVVRRHPALRASFTIVDGRPHQTIALAVAVKLPVVDLADVVGAERTVRALEVVEQELTRGFKLTDPSPPWRAVLVRLAGDDHILGMNLHGIISDGVARRIVIREVFAVYEAMSAGRSFSLPSPPVDYVEFVMAQHRWLRGPDAAEQLEYWRRQLRGIRQLELVGDRERGLKSFRGRRRPYAPPGAVVRQLKALNEREGVTLYLSLLAVLGALLRGYTGQDDVVVSTTVSTRSLAAAETLVGNFTNTVLMRCDLSGDPTFRELLSRLRGMALETYARKDFPVTVLASELGLDQRQPAWPVDQVTLVLHQDDPAELAAVEARFVWIDLGKADGDLAVGLIDHSAGVNQPVEYLGTGETVWPQELNGLVEYDTDLFDDATIARFQSHFDVFMERAVEDPDRRCSELLRGLEQLTGAGRVAGEGR